MRTTQWLHDITDQEYHLWHHRRKLAVQVLSHLPTRHACAPNFNAIEEKNVSVTRKSRTCSTLPSKPRDEALFCSSASFTWTLSEKQERRSRRAGKREGEAITYSASGLQAGFERAVLFDRGDHLLKKGIQIVLASVDVLLHTSHKVLKIFLADDLEWGQRMKHRTKGMIPC